MQQTSDFYGSIDGQYVIPGTHTAVGGTTNFNFGCPPLHGQTARAREPFTTVPFAPDPDFIDRPDILTWVRNKCAGAGARAALVGLGGVGKSQLAIQYAHSIRDISPQTFVFWVHASTRARFKEAYRDIAERLQLPGRSDPNANVLRLVSDWLRDEANGRWLMVVDNVDDVETFYPSLKQQQDKADASAPTLLAGYLPQSRNGSILITSRSKDAAARLAGGHNKIKEVLAMNECEGLQLLHNKLRDSPLKENAVELEESAVELLRALNCIPLAISQAAAYINQRARMTVAGYLAEFQRNSKKQKSLLNWDAGELRRDESASNSVVTTWQMSFEQIRRERRSAAELLSLMSFFNPQGIPDSTLRRYSNSAAGVTDAEDEEEANSRFDEDLNTLHAYSLVSITADKNAYKMHALVQFCTQVWLSSFSDVEQWEHKFVALMAQELPTGEYENWAKCQQLLPHVERLYNAIPATKEALKAWAQVLTNAAWYLWLQGSYSTAQQIAAKALNARENELGLDDRQTQSSVDILALVLQYQGKYEEAEVLHRRALKNYEQLGVEHVNRLMSMNNLAGVLRQQGKYEEAVILNWQALEGFREMLGERHPDTLTCMDSLAGVLEGQGKYEEAEKLNRRALEGYMELGEQHPGTLIIMGNLARVLQYQGKYEEAGKLNRRALEGSKKVLGERHPDTLTSVSNLAAVLQYQGKYEEAETLNRQALEGREKMLGERHPVTLSSVSNLARVLRYQGKYKEAETLHLRALEGSEKVLGERHPDTLTSVSDLAAVLQDQGKYEETEKLNRRALEGYMELGEQHPSTLIIMGNLARVLQDQGKYEEAEKLNWRALKGYMELGAQYPSTLTIMGNLVAVLQDQGKYEEAGKLNRRALEGSEKVLGERHPHTLTSVYSLAYLLHKLHRYTEAAELYQQACDGRTEQLGPDHPHTIACRKHFAAMQQEVKQTKSGEQENPPSANICFQQRDL